MPEALQDALETMSHEAKEAVWEWLNTSVKARGALLYDEVHCDD